MDNKLRELRITRISITPGGIWVFTKHPNWQKYEYSFFILPEGDVKGRTFGGIWVDLSYDTTSLIRNKLQRFLKDNELVDTYSKFFP